MSWKILALLIGLALAYGVLLPVMLGVLKMAKNADEQSERYYLRFLWLRGRREKSRGRATGLAAKN